ncbi:MAG: radical SAM/SPASM domain-containing protein [Bdellovibrionia bacterium]
MFTWRTYKSIAKALITRRSPYYVQFYIIGKCNLKCRQCNIVETNSRIGEMSLDQIRKTAKNLRDVGAGIVLLTGGEPFMRPDLPEIVDIFVGLGLNVRLQTAGTHYATEEKLQACYDAGARDINVSLDSLDFNTFDYINAVPGSAQNAIETIERISRVFRKGSSVLSFGTVLSRFNHREIPAILEFAKRIGWYVSLVPVHIAPKDSPRGFRSFDDLFRFDSSLYGDLDRTIERVLEMKEEGWPLFDSERYVRSAVSFLKGNGPSWRKNNVCDSPDLYFVVRPNGDFTTCCDYTLSAPPKVYDDRFKILYNSGALRRMSEVRQIVENCEGCHYGSYPEVSLSVNDPRVFFERSWMVMKSGKGKLSQAQVTANFVDEVRRVREEFSEIYPVSNWQDPRISQIVSAWADSEKRKEILRQDNEKRKNQNRVRGSGPEPVFPKGAPVK